MSLKALHAIVILSNKKRATSILETASLVRMAHHADVKDFTKWSKRINDDTE